MRTQDTTGRVPGARPSDLPDSLILTPSQLDVALRELARYRVAFFSCPDHAEQVRDAAEEQTGLPYRVRRLWHSPSCWVVEPMHLLHDRDVSRA